MNIISLHAADLSASQMAAWSDLQRADPALDSPYFRPEFTRAVAEVREGVEVAVLEEGGRPVGFLPFQRGTRNVGRAVAWGMTDFQGAIVARDVAWTPREVLRACGLRAWHFDHLLAAQEPLRPYHWETAPSPYIDLSAGWEAYEATRMAEHKETFKKIYRKWRRAEREAGPLRFELHTPDPAVFHTLMDWKDQQYRETGALNFTSFGWTVDLLQRVLAEGQEPFAGRLSALYFGDRLVAGLLWLRSYDVVHAWISAHGPDESNLSPGLLLWLAVTKALAGLGVRRVDLGKGPEPYKLQWMSGSIEVALGSVDFRPVTGMLRRQWHRAYRWVAASRLRRPLLVPGRFLRHLVESKGFRE